MSRGMQLSARSLCLFAAGLPMLLIIIVVGFLTAVTTAANSDDVLFTFTMSPNGYSEEALERAMGIVFQDIFTEPTFVGLHTDEEPSSGNLRVHFSFGGDNGSEYTDFFIDFCVKYNCNDMINTPVGKGFSQAGLVLFAVRYVRLTDPPTSIAPESPTPTPLSPAPTGARFTFVILNQDFHDEKLALALEDFFGLGSVTLSNVEEAIQPPTIHVTCDFGGPTGGAYNAALFSFCSEAENECESGPPAMVAAFEHSQQLSLYYVWVEVPPTPPPTSTEAPTEAPTEEPITTATTTTPPPTAATTSEAPTSDAPSDTTASPETTAPPPSPVTPDPTAVSFYSNCATNVCELDSCSVTTYAADQCVVQGSMAILFDCNPTAAPRCVELQAFTNKDCTHFNQAGSLVCGACGSSSGADGGSHYLVDCTDEAAVVLRTGCDDACSNGCTGGSTVPLPPNTCVGGLYAMLGWASVAVGAVRDCSAVTMSLFSGGSGGCVAGSRISQSTVEQGTCNQKTSIICPNYSPQPSPTFAPVHPPTSAPPTPAPPPTAYNYTTYADPLCITATAQPVVVGGASGACVPLDATSSEAGPLRSMRQQCHGDHSNAATASCAGVTFFDDETCTHISRHASLACNSCSSWEAQRSNGSEYFGCASAGATAELSTGCNDGCVACAIPKQRLDPGACTEIIRSNGARAYVVLNELPRSCATVTRLFFSGSSECAPASLQSYATVEQGACTAAGITRCEGEEPAPPTPSPPSFPPYPPNPPANEKIYVTACSDVHCSLNCVQKTPFSGICADSSTPGGSDASSLYKCIAGVDQCVEMTLFSGENCAVIDRRFAPVCGSCHFFSGAYFRFECNTSGAGTFEVRSDCDAACSSCATSDAPISYGVCGESTRLGRMLVLPPEPCYPVQQQTFSARGCGGNMTSLSVHAQDSCSGGQFVVCPYRGQTPEPTSTAPGTDEPAPPSSSPATATEPHSTMTEMPTTTDTTTDVIPTAMTTTEEVPTTMTATPPDDSTSVDPHTATSDAPPSSAPPPAPTSTHTPSPHPSSDPRRIVFVALFASSADSELFSTRLADAYPTLAFTINFTETTGHDNGTVSRMFVFQGEDAATINALMEFATDETLRAEFGVLQLSYAPEVEPPTSAPRGGSKPRVPAGALGAIIAVLGIAAVVAVVALTRWARRRKVDVDVDESDMRETLTSIQYSKYD